MMFSGFTSRWTIPTACAAASASMIGSMIPADSATESLRLAVGSSGAGEPLCWGRMPHPRDQLLAVGTLLQVHRKLADRLLGKPARDVVVHGSLCRATC